jgi:large subunit ribosomal protein L31
MKKGIHPNYKVVEIAMTDGTTFQTRSTFRGERMVLDIDSKSHPFFTGKQMLVDTAGRVDRFNKRFEKTQKMKEPKADAKPEAKPDEKPDVQAEATSVQEAN